MKNYSLSPICVVCNKHRKLGDHERCSQIQKEKNKNRKSYKSSKTVRPKDIEFFAKIK